jgi:hypothetical protein
MRGHYHGRSVRLELARRHDILRLWLWLVVRIPLGHLLHVLGIAVGGRIVLGMVVLRIWVVVHRRVCLGRHVVVVLVVLPPALVHGTGRRAMRAWHHGQHAAMLPLQSVAGQTDQAANVRGNGGRRRATGGGMAELRRGGLGKSAGWRDGCDDAGVDNYCWDADEGRATGRGRLRQVAGQLAERGVIVSARHERSRDCPRGEAQGRREGAAWEGLRSMDGKSSNVAREQLPAASVLRASETGIGAVTAANTPWRACLCLSVACPWPKGAELRWSPNS